MKIIISESIRRDLHFINKNMSYITDKMILITKKISTGDHKGIVKLKNTKESIFRFRKRDFRIIFDFGKVNDELIVRFLFFKKRSNVYEETSRKEKHRRIIENIDGVDAEQLIKSESHNNFNIESETKKQLSDEININSYYIDSSYLDKKNQKKLNDFLDIEYHNFIWCYDRESNKIIDEISNQICENTNSINIMKGPPGTGKSLILFKLLEKSVKKGKKVILLLPTKKLGEQFFIPSLKHNNISYKDFLTEKDILEIENHKFVEDVIIYQFDSFYAYLSKSGLFPKKKDIIKQIDKMKKHSSNEKLKGISSEIIYYYYLSFIKATDMISNREKDFNFKYYEEEINDILKGSKELFNRLKRKMKKEKLDDPIDIVEKVKDKEVLQKIIRNVSENCTILIDEVQNLFNCQVKKICDIVLLKESKCNLIVAGDVFQRTVPNDFSFEEIITYVWKKYKIELKENTLTKCHRLSKQIADYADINIKMFFSEKLGKHNTRKNYSIITGGDCLVEYKKPTLVIGGYKKLIIALTKIKLKNNDKIIIIYNKTDKKIKCDIIEKISNDNITAIDSDSVKGLEFDNIILLNLIPKLDTNAKEMTSLYMAVTRARYGILHYIDVDKYDVHKAKYRGYQNRYCIQNANILSVQEVEDQIMSFITEVRDEHLLRIIENHLEQYYDKPTEELFKKIINEANKYSEIENIDKTQLFKLIRRIKDEKSFDNIFPKSANEILIGISEYYQGHYINACLKFVENNKKDWLIDVIQKDKKNISNFEFAKITAYLKDINEYTEVRKQYLTRKEKLKHDVFDDYLKTVKSNRQISDERELLLSYVADKMKV